jgi:pyridoxamine 5'-phosphate oxidase
VVNRAQLEAQLEEVRARFDPSAIPLPEQWGGYRVAPSSLEFWQGRQSRLHDRLRYSLATDSLWSLERLSP